MSFIGIGTIIPDIVNLPGQTGEGISAAFSYSKSSFRQDESDPTPTITGTQGGTFTSSPSGLSINSSTGTIDLSISAIRSYTITYTVQGISAQQSLSVLSPLGIDNNFSMAFDGSSTYIYGPPLGDLIDLGGSTSKFTISCWFYAPAQQYKGICGSSHYSNGIKIYTYGNTITYGIAGGAAIITGTANYAGGWHHMAATCDLASSGTTMRLYFDGSEIANGSGNRSGNPFGNFNLDIGAFNSASGTPNNFWLGNIDEFAVFNEVLSATTIQDIYNATANNSSKVYDLSQVTEGAPVAWYRMGD